MSRARVELAAGIIALVAVLLAIASPLRETSGDTVPGRIGGAVLRCAGTFDLSRVDWVREETDRQRTFYFIRFDRADEHTSTFGPAPAVIGALALLDFGEGDRIADRKLRSRERLAASLLIALSAVLLMLAAFARANLARSIMTGAVAVLAFSGAATLSQGLWQATTALPCLVGALATLAWRYRMPRIAIATPALLALAVMLRPTIAPLVLGLGVTWALETRSSWRTWIIAIAIALVAVSPLIVWNAIHLNSPLPLGQWKVNRQLTDSVVSVGSIGTGIAGLLVSPARGLLWFAPIAIVGIVRGLRSKRWRYIAAGILLQVVVMGLFFKWHGGLAFGPRLLAESTWVATWLALGTTRVHEGGRFITTVAAVLTCIVGQLGLWLWRPEQWESRRVPETHPGAFWDVKDSPLSSTLMPTPAMPHAHDSPPTNGLTCEDGRLRSW